MPHAKGSFEVKITPQPGGHITFEKEIHGEFEGTSSGEMLTAMTSVPTSAAYVAVERYTGTLNGRAGTFVATHRAVRTSASHKLEVEMVPDSGTGDLTGISGTITINPDHTYDIDYTL